MAWEPTLAVHGALGTAAQVRADIYGRSRGARGIELPGDLKVTATGTPSGSVNISRGSAVAPSPWRPGESYQIRNASADLFDIPATGSAGGRTEYVIVKVIDHNFDGSPPPVLNEDGFDDTTHIEVTRVASLSGLNYPYVPLAKLVIPASTAAITNAMITDVRHVYNPVVDTFSSANELVIAEIETLTQTRDDGEYWPNAGGVQYVDIPANATRALIRAEWHSVTMPASNAWGRIWVGWGDLPSGGTRREMNTQEVAWNSVGSGTTYTTNLTVVADRYIPAKYRGRTNTPFTAFGRRISGSGPTMTELSSFSLEVIFKSVAD